MFELSGWFVYYHPPKILIEYYGVGNWFGGVGFGLGLGYTLQTTSIPINGFDPDSNRGVPIRK